MTRFCTGYSEWQFEHSQTDDPGFKNCVPHWSRRCCSVLPTVRSQWHKEVAQWFITEATLQLFTVKVYEWNEKVLEKHPFLMSPLTLLACFYVTKKSQLTFAQINLINLIAFESKYYSIKTYNEIILPYLQKVFHSFNMCLALEWNQTTLTLLFDGTNCNFPCKLSQQSWNAFLIWIFELYNKDNKDRTDNKNTINIICLNYI